jgi:CRISPR-associated protein (TIGR02584 family)
MADVYLLAPMGTSPAVVTETLWHLVVSEAHRVVGVELWVTDSAVGAPRTSLAALRSRVARGLWARLRRALGTAAERMPELPRLFPAHGPDPRRALADPLLVYRFERDGEPMADVRDLTDAALVGKQLHARVRHLCGVLGETVLVGLISGGRKNFAPALQGAFELQGRPQDRLLHVLVHEDLESDAEVMADYVAPEAMVNGVPVDRQLQVYDVPCPPLRYLPLDGPWRDALDRDDVGEVWSALRANLSAAGQHTARLEGTGGQRWQLVIERDEQKVYVLPLTAGQAETYAALIAVPAGTDDPFADWGDHIDANRLGRRTDGPRATLEEAMRRRLSALANATAPLAVVGLGEFALHLDGKNSHIPAAARVAGP